MTTTRTTAAKSAPKTARTRKPAAAAAKRKPAASRARGRTVATRGRPSAVSIGAAILAVGAGIAGFLARRQITAWATRDTAGHAAPDLALDQPRPDAGVRAPLDFRLDIAAPISPAEREGLRPATGPAPLLVGSTNSQTGATH